MERIAYKFDSQLPQIREEFYRPILCWSIGLWQYLCQQAERDDRFVPYC